LLRIDGPEQSLNAGCRHLFSPRKKVAAVFAVSPTGV
jgi:hypothetical protein